MISVNHAVFTKVSFLRRKSKRMFLGYAHVCFYVLSFYKCNKTDKNNNIILTTHIDNGLIYIQTKSVLHKLDKNKWIVFTSSTTFQTAIDLKLNMIGLKLGYGLSESGMTIKQKDETKEYVTEKCKKINDDTEYT